MNFISFDIESCTGKPNDGSLCSFGYYKAGDGFEPLGGEDITVNPLPKYFYLGKRGDARTIELAYPVSHFRSRPRFDAFYGKIKDLFASADVAVGFALGNDLRYINDACDKFGLNRIEFEYIDAQLIGGLVIPELKNYGLKAFADRFSLEFVEHRSDEDARIALEVLKRSVELYGKPLAELMEDFGVVAGKNTAEGFTACFSYAEQAERVKAMSKSTRHRLSDYYTENASAEKRGNRLEGKLCVSPTVFDFENGADVFYTAAAEGATLVKTASGADYFVTVRGDRFLIRLKSISRARVIYADEFFKKFSPMVPAPVSYLDALSDRFFKPVKDN